MGRYATGVSVIVTNGPDGAHGMTANSLTSVSLDPLLLLFCVRHGARTDTLVRSSRRFSVNVLSHDQVGLSRMFARQQHELDCVEWIDLQGIPALADSEAVFVCDLRDAYRAGDHSIMLGEVTGMHGRREARAPLVFYRGSYHLLSSTC